MQLENMQGSARLARSPAKEVICSRSIASRYAGLCCDLPWKRRVIFSSRAGHIRFQPDGVAEYETGKPVVAAETSSEPISWTARWWPVMPLDSLDTKLPVHVDLLDMSLVVWADSQGAWHCLEDKCPHRLAPLSEGRVEGDTLMCSYHGWTFSSSGACTNIPQLNSDPKAHASACSSKRSCTRSYPVRSAHGLLWIWPEAGQAAAMQAQAQPEQQVRSEGMTAWFVRDLPMRYDTLLENMLDPSHLPFAHHGVGGINRNKPFSTTKAWEHMQCGKPTVEGFVASVQTAFGLQSWTFSAPLLTTAYASGEVQLQNIVVPTKPGWSRIMLNTPVDSPQLPEPIRTIHRIRQGMPGFNHPLFTNSVFDGDNYLLHVAERHLPVINGVGSKTTLKAHYMPGPVDGLITGMRTWIQKCAGDIPTCKAQDDPRMPPLLSKREVLDRWEQHTKNCSHCKKALALVDKGLLASTVLGALSAMAAMGQLAAWAALAQSAATAANLQLPTMACTVVALLCASVYRRLTGLRTKFFYEDYVHAVRD